MLIEVESAVVLQGSEEGPGLARWPKASTAILALLTAACGGGGGSSEAGGSAATGQTGGSAGGSTGAGGNTSATSVSPIEKFSTRAEASRFLSQASFGPRDLAQIDELLSKGPSVWLAEQFEASAQSHLDYLREQSQQRSEGRPEDYLSYEAIWQQWLYGDDQLRARMAFALSQIFVISNIAPDLEALAMSSYMDMLNRNAFGNYRTLLEEVTLHPAMGYYLNMLENEKEDPASGRFPNENYAREVLQLFSIGLVQLNPDGTARLGGDGKPVPSYDQSVVGGFARVFSGWGFAGRNTSRPDSFDNGEPNWTEPMQAWPSKHSSAPKTLLNGVSLPAGQTPQKDLKDALDNIFRHPNVGPFIARRLIQRLVSSNPSPAYIGRVAAVFADNGSGVRGDLKATLRAILLDREARDPPGAGAIGKQREPVIRLANLLRILDARAKDGTNRLHYLDDADNGLGQSPLLAPTVFNFFSPDYRQPGPIAQAGLVSPEFQITTETSVVGTLNFFAGLIRSGGYGYDDGRLELKFDAFDELAGNVPALIERLNLLLMNGAMSSTTADILSRALQAIPATRRRERVQAALILSAVAPDFVVQR